jgi:phage terminase large subunit
VGTGGNVFDNLELREITDAEVKTFDRIYQGVDWGFYPDAFAFIRMHYDRARDTLYLLDEHYVHKQSNESTGSWIREKGYTDAYIICDSAEPKSVADFRTLGLPAKSAVKGPGSLDYSMKWLQRRKIVIDRRRTPHAYTEFTNYEYERNKEGDIISGYPDADDHVISAVRYGMEPVYRRMGELA